jgi:dTDP-4-dehydrorhamnose reductase
MGRIIITGKNGYLANALKRAIEQKDCQAKVELLDVRNSR